MANQKALKDPNFVSTMIGESSAVAGETARVKVNPSTGAVLTEVDGGSGSAVTIADAADVAQGAVADAVVAAGAAGTVSAKLRRITTDLAAILLNIAPIEQTGLSAGALNADLVASTDVSAYARVSIQVAGTWSGTLIAQNSNDNTNWATTNVSSTGANFTNVTSNGVYTFVVKAKYFRFRMLGYSSGTATGVAEFLSTPSTEPSYVTASQTGTWTVQPGNTANTTPWLANTSTPYPSAATPLTAASGNVANAAAAATLAGTSGKTTYITGFEITGSGATLGAAVTVTVTGTISGTLSYTYAAIAGALLANTPLVVEFPVAIPASATNTAIVVSCPALGGGNTNNTTVAHGYQL